MSDESVFAAALAIHSPTQRAAYLDRVCAGQPDLRHQVEELLAAHAADNLLDRPPADLGRTSAYEPLVEQPGVTIGPYKLLQEIGEGGMGTVFMAEQTQPVRRKVALKIIKPGMDSKQVVARFEAERQALSMMDHPNIAKVFDAGTTVSGRPYFVMELVHGVPFTEFCDANKLTPRQRLELFVPVCLAIQHAHQKGIIHRDIKPGNILVTMYDDKPVPKVIDFGVAKAVEQRLTERTLFTQFGTLVGTFEYMSPEQAEMNALGVDTRSDVYALGVLLYELLTGTTPLERQRLRAAALGEVVRLIKEEEPPRPSVRLSTSGKLAKVAASRQMEPGKLSALVRGELDWIVMRCLEKDRTRRYDTASSLARDVERYLHDEPVEACPPTIGYRLRKTFRKHKAAVIVASGFVAVLLLGIVMTAWQAIRATGAEELAAGERDLAIVAHRESEQQRDQAKRANESLRRLAAEQRRTLYATSMNLAQAAWETGDPARTFDLLRQQIPQPGEEDLRGLEWHYWNRTTHQEVVKTAVIPDLAGLGADPAFRYGARVSPDGRFVAAFVAGHGGSGTDLTVWDSDSGRQRWHVPVDADPGEFPYVAFSLDGRRLVTVHRPRQEKIQVKQDSRQLRVWDIDAGRQVFALDKKVLSCPALSADGSRLAVVTGSIRESDKGLVVFQLPDGRELFRYPAEGTKAIVISAAITADGKRVAAAGGGGPTQTSLTTQAVRMWEVDGGRELWSAELPGQEFVTIGLSPDGHRVAVPLASASAKNSVAVLDGRTGQKKATLAVPGWSGATSLSSPVVFDPSGDRLAVRQGAEVHLFDVAPTDSAGAPSLRTVRGHANAVWDVAVSESRMVTLDRGGTLKQWDLDSRTKEPRVRFGTPGAGSAVMPSPDGSRVMTLPHPLGSERRVRFTDGTGREVGGSELPPGRSRERAFSADSHTFVTIWQPDPLIDQFPMVVWDARTGVELARRDASPGYGCNTLAVSPDGSRIVSQTMRLRGSSAQEPYRLIVWEPSTGREICSRGFNWFVAPFFTADGRRLLSVDAGAGRAETRFVWLDPETGAETRSVTVRRGLLNLGDSIVFSRDGRRMATLPSWTEDPVRVWDFEAMDRGGPAEPLFTLDGHGTRVFQVAFSPDNRRVLTASLGQVKLWEGASGRELLTLKTSGTGSDGAYFSPDGQTIWGGLDEDGRLWGWDGTPLPEGKAP